VADAWDFFPCPFLLDYWLVELEEIKIAVGTDLRMFSGVYAWAQHCHHVGLQFIQITECTPWWGTVGALGRLCHELAVKAQRVSQVEGALDSGSGSGSCSMPTGGRQGLDPGRVPHSPRPAVACASPLAG
jgi:hypothetical protein